MFFNNESYYILGGTMMKNILENLKWTLWKAYVFGSLILMIASIQIIGILFGVSPLLVIVIGIVVIVNSIILFRVV